MRVQTAPVQGTVSPYHEPSTLKLSNTFKLATPNVMQFITELQRFWSKASPTSRGRPQQWDSAPSLLKASRRSTQQLLKTCTEGRILHPGPIILLVCTVFHINLDDESQGQSQHRMDAGNAEPYLPIINPLKPYLGFCLAVFVRRWKHRSCTFFLRPTINDAFL